MENKRNIRRWLPVAAALAVFVLINLFYFAPQFSGQTLLQGDVQQYKGSSEDIMQHREKYGEDPQWEGNMFGGMPAYLINVQYEGTVIKTLSKAFYFLGQPAALIFIAMTAFFFMLLCMRFNPWIGIVPSLAYGFSTYFFIIIGAGHVTKMMALAFAPMLFGGVWYAFRRNMWVGAALTGVFASIEIGVNHPQITYYFLFILAAFWINELVSAARAKALPRFAKTTGLLALAAVLAVGSNAGMLYYINSHSAETMRGGSELREARTGEKQQGLDIEYATAWSYGPGETFNLLIPNLYGGSSEGGFSGDGAVADALGKYNARQVAAHLPGYWGPQPGTSGPVYVGAAALLLAVLGLFVLRGRSKWWVAAVALLAVLLSWGNHFVGLTELFFRHFPMYNKFRTVSMILVIVEWCVPFLAAVVLQRIWCGRIEHARLMKGLKYSRVDGRRHLVAVSAVRRRVAVVLGRSRFADAVAGRRACRDARRAGVDDACRCAALAGVRAAGGRSGVAVRDRQNQAGRAGGGAGRDRDGRYGTGQPALFGTRTFRARKRRTDQADGSRPADTGRYGRRTRIPRAESDRQPVQRCVDFVFSPLGGRVPRGEAAPLPRPDRASSVEDELERVRHAQHALRDRSVGRRPRRFGAAQRRGRTGAASVRWTR